MSISTELRVGVIDLMSGAAGMGARRQFSTMLKSAAGEVGISLQIVEMSLAPDGLSAGPEACGIDRPEVTALEAMIVTGAEPRSAELRFDPVLPVIERLMEASAASVTSTVFSCLAAHAALRVLCSVDRTTLAEKQFGVFTHRLSDPEHPLVAGVDSVASVPHSRWNRISRTRLSTEGVTTVMELSTDDWHMASSSDGLKYIFFQGHPEYDGDTLFREYRRDVRRFLTGITDRYPEIPVGYFDASSIGRLTEFRELAQRIGDASVLEFFPEIVIRPDCGWGGAAQTVAKNWLNAVVKERIGKE
jgi:homoserine O-succinyltransferase